MSTNDQFVKIFETHHGKKVWANTDVCVAWKAHHGNCEGCKHFDHCDGCVRWILSMLAGHAADKYLDNPLTYEPPRF